MDKLEKVELIREKTGVSYDDAKVALEASNDDVLDAIIWLERMGKAETQTASYSTYTDYDYGYGAASPEMAEAQYAYEESSKKGTFGEKFDSAFEYVKGLCKKGLDTTFVAERNGENAIRIPVLILIIGLFLWGATLWLLIIGLFFGFRYHIEGASAVTVDVNKMMDKAGEVADSIKDTVTGDKDN